MFAHAQKQKTCKSLMKLNGGREVSCVGSLVLRLVDCSMINKNTKVVITSIIVNYSKMMS